MAVICKRNQTTYGNLMTLHTSGGTSRAGLEIESNGDGNNLQWQYDGSFVDGSFTVTNADGWVLLAAGKATGTTVVRMHKYVFSAGTWTHQDTGGTSTNSTAPGASSTMRFGQWEGADDFNGDVAVAAAWMGRNLSDAEVELLPASLISWIASAPDAMWVFDQAATTTALNDLTGNGANQSALTGTTVSANSGPFVTYGDDVIVLSSSAASGSSDATVTPSAVSASTTVPSPTVATGSTVTAAVVSATTTVPAPTPSGGATVIAAAVQSTTTVASPTLATGSTVIPAAVTATTTVPAPSTSSSSTVTATAVSTAASVPAPSLATGSTVAAAAVQAAATIPAPSISAGGNANVTPSAVLGSTTVPAPTTQAGSTVAAPAVLAVVSIPLPSLSTGSAIHVAAVAGLASVPSVAVTTTAAVGAGTMHLAILPGATAIAAPVTGATAQLSIRSGPTMTGV